MIALQQFIIGSQREMSELKQPLFLAKGMLDEAVFHESTDLIVASAQSDVTVKKRYENSGTCWRRMFWGFRGVWSKECFQGTYLIE